MNKIIIDYVTGKITHDEFEAELYLNPQLWKEIQNLVPSDIADTHCLFREYYCGMEGFETNNYSVKATINSFGFKKYIAHSLISALVSYNDNSIVPHEPIEDTPEDILEKIKMYYIGGTEADDIIRSIMSENKTGKEIKEKLKKMFPCKTRKHPEWVQEPEWPVVSGVPMRFVSQKNDGDKYEYVFEDINSDTIRVIIQLA